jgi:hypothetical protein
MKLFDKIRSAFLGKRQCSGSIGEYNTEWESPDGKYKLICVRYDDGNVSTELYQKRKETKEYGLIHCFHILPDRVDSTLG